MDRNKYLRLCQQNKANPNSVIVVHKDCKYYPDHLVLWFNDRCELQNTTRLVSVVGSSEMLARVEDVEELENAH